MINNNYFALQIRNEKSVFVLVKGKKLTLPRFESLDLFTYKNETMGMFHVIEARSGFGLGFGRRSFKDTEKAAHNILKTRGIVEVEQVIHRAIKYQLSPRYK